MTDSQLLFAVLAFIYLTDCLAWADHYSVGFWTLTGRRWRWSRPGGVLGNHRGGVLLNPPLPPLGTALVARPWPISLSPDAVCSYVAEAPGMDRRPPQEECYRRFDEIKSVEVLMKDVYANGSLLVGTGRPAQARRLCRLISRIASIPESDRPAAIDSELAAAFDMQAVRDRVESLRQAASSLAWPCNLLFMLIFVAGPAVVWAYGWPRNWRGLMACLVVTLVMVVWEYARAHRALFPEERGERRLHATIMLLNPLAAIRARDALSRDLLVAFHPVAIAAALCPQEAFLEFARRVYLDALWPMKLDYSAPEPAVAETVRWFSSRLRAAMERCLREAGVDPETLARPDPPEDQSCLSYCPRCRTQFVLEGGECSACGGLALRSFKVSQAV